MAVVPIGVPQVGGGPGIFSGAGSPESIIAAAIGAVYLETATGALWHKTSGSGATGWIRTDFGSATDKYPGLMGPVFNVKAFGAKGDGVTSVNAAFQACAAAIAAVGGGHLFIPPADPGGWYSFTGSSSPVVDLPSNCIVIGSGQAGLLKAATGATFSHWFRISGKSHVTVRNCHFDGNAMPAFRACVILRGTDPSNIRIENNYFFDSNPPAPLGQDRYAVGVVPEGGHAQNVWIVGNQVENGMQIKAGGSAKNVYVLHNRVKDAVNNAISFVTSVDDVNVFLQDCIIGDNIIDNPTLQGVYAGSDGGVHTFTFRRVRIIHNIIRRSNTNANFGILVSNTPTTSDIDISHNTVVFDGGTPAGEGIRIEDATGTTAVADRVTVVGNVVSGFDIANIRVNDVKNLVFANNISVGSRGFIFDEIQGATITGNVADGAVATSGFRFDATSDTLVQGNIAKNGATNVDGFRVSPAVGKVAELRFIGNRAFGSTQRFGVNEVAGGTFDTQYIDNDFSGNATGGLNNINAAAYRRGNRLTTGAQQGRAVLVNGTVTVNTTEIQAGDNVQLTRVLGTATTRGILTVGTITAGTSFVIRAEDLAGALSADDDSTVFWEIVH